MSNREEEQHQQQQQNTATYVVPSVASTDTTGGFDVGALGATARAATLPFTFDESQITVQGGPLREDRMSEAEATAALNRMFAEANPSLTDGTDAQKSAMFVQIIKYLILNGSSSQSAPARVLSIGSHTLHSRFLVAATGNNLRKFFRYHAPLARRILTVDMNFATAAADKWRVDSQHAYLAFDAADALQGLTRPELAIVQAVKRRALRGETSVGELISAQDVNVGSRRISANTLGEYQGQRMTPRDNGSF